MMKILDTLKVRAVRLKLFKPGTEIYILSYPKCGRTWLRLLVGKAICDRFGLPEAQMIDTYGLTAVPGIRRTHFSHDYSSLLTGFRYDRMPTDKSEYAATKVIFLVRDVRDVLVSSYFQATKRINRFDGPISDFIRDDRFGARKIISYYNIWHRNQAVPRDFLLLRYELMHADPHAALTRTLECMEMDGLTPQLVADAVEFARFDNMKRLEKSGFFQDDKMKPGDEQDKESFKVRKGKVGGYEEYLNADDLAYIDQVIADLGCPFCS